MGIPVSISPETIGSVGVPTNILAHTRNLIIFDANLGAATHNDWNESGVASVPGTSGGGPLFPMGALLGFPGTAMEAYPAGPATQAYTGKGQLVYTWTTAAVIANRGSAGNQNIAASVPGNAVVLAKDVDNTGTVVGQERVVPIIWQGTFTPRGILQDHESVTAFAATDRLQIAPSSGWQVG